MLLSTHISEDHIKILIALNKLMFVKTISKTVTTMKKKYPGVENNLMPNK
jgi:hypothetical protein